METASEPRHANTDIGATCERRVNSRVAPDGKEERRGKRSKVYRDDGGRRGMRDEGSEG